MEINELLQELEGDTPIAALENFNTYIESCSNAQGTINGFLLASDNCNEIINLLVTDKRTSSEVCTIFSALSHILINIASELKEYFKIGLHITRQLLHNHEAHLYKFLLPTNTNKNTKAVLRCLTGMVLLGKESANEVLVTLNWDQINISLIANRQSVKDVWDVRAWCIYFVLAFLNSTEEPHIIQLFLQKKDVLCAIFPGLMWDPFERVINVIKVMHQSILLNPSISKTTKVNLFSPISSKPLLDLYNWRGPMGKLIKGDNIENLESDVADTILRERNMIREELQKFNLALLTSHKNGIVFQEKIQRGKVRSNNTYVYDIITNIKTPWKIPECSELMSKFLGLCPDLLDTYFESLSEDLNPRPRKSFIAMIDFISETIACQKPWKRLKDRGVRGMLDCLLPRSLNISLFKSLIENPYISVRDCGLRLTLSILYKLKETFNKITKLPTHSLSVEEDMRRKIIASVFSSLLPINSIANCWNLVVGMGGIEEAEFLEEHVDSADIIPLSRHLLVIAKTSALYGEFVPSQAINKYLNPLYMLQNIRSISEVYESESRLELQVICMGFLTDNNTGFLADNNTGFLADNNTGFLPDNNTGFLTDNNTGFLADNNTGFLADNNTGFLADNNTGFLADNNTGFLPDNNTGFLPDNNTGFLADNNTGFLPDKNTGFLTDNNTGFSMDTDECLSDSEMGKNVLYLLISTYAESKKYAMESDSESELLWSVIETCQNYLIAALDKTGLASHYDGNIKFWLTPIYKGDILKLSAFLTRIIQLTVASLNQYTDRLVEIGSLRSDSDIGSNLTHPDSNTGFDMGSDTILKVLESMDVCDNTEVSEQAMSLPFSRLIFGALELLTKFPDPDYVNYFSGVIDEYLFSIPDPGILVQMLLNEESLQSSNLKTYLECWVKRTKGTHDKQGNNSNNQGNKSNNQGDKSNNQGNNSNNQGNNVFELCDNPGLSDIIKYFFMTQDWATVEKLLEGGELFEGKELSEGNNSNISNRVIDLLDKGDLDLVITQILIYLSIQLRSEKTGANSTPDKKDKKIVKKYIYLLKLIYEAFENDDENGEKMGENNEKKGENNEKKGENNGKGDENKENSVENDENVENNGKDDENNVKEGENTGKNDENVENNGKNDENNVKEGENTGKNDENVENDVKKSENVEKSNENVENNKYAEIVLRMVLEHPMMLSSYEPFINKKSPLTQLTQEFIDIVLMKHPNVAQKTYPYFKTMVSKLQNLQNYKNHRNIDVFAPFQNFLLSKNTVINYEDLQNLFMISFENLNIRETSHLSMIREIIKLILETTSAKRRLSPAAVKFAFTKFMQCLNLVKGDDLSSEVDTEFIEFMNEFEMLLCKVLDSEFIKELPGEELKRLIQCKPYTKTGIYSGTNFGSGIYSGTNAGIYSGTNAGIYSGTNAGMYSGTNAGIYTGLCHHIVKQYPPSGRHFARYLKKHTAVLPDQAPLLALLLQQNESASIPALTKITEALKSWVSDFDADDDQTKLLIPHALQKSIFEMDFLKEVFGKLYEWIVVDENQPPTKILSILPLLRKFTESEYSKIGGKMESEHSKIGGKKIESEHSGIGEKIESEHSGIGEKIESEHSGVGEKIESDSSKFGKLALFEICLSCIRKLYKQKQDNSHKLIEFDHVIREIVIDVEIEGRSCSILSCSKLWGSYVKQVLRKGLGDIKLGPVLVNQLSELFKVIYKNMTSDQILPPPTLYSMIMGHTNYLTLIFNRESEWGYLREQVIKLQLDIVTLYPNVCQDSHIPVLLGAYTGSMSTADQCILILLNKYEREGHMRKIQPLLWGDAAVSHFGVGLHTLGFYKEPTLEQTLGLIDLAKLSLTCRKFEVTIPLEAAEIYTADNSVYDVRFLLPLMLYLARDKKMSEIDYAECGAVQLGLTALTSHHKEVWGIGAALLKYLVQKMEVSKHPRLKLPWQWLVAVVSCAMEGRWRRLPSVTVQFLVEASLLLSQPSHPMYQAVMNYVFLFPAFKIYNVPELYGFFASKHVTNHRTQQVFLLNNLANGIKNVIDYRICQRNFTSTLMMGLIQSTTADVELKVQVLDVLEAMVRINVGAVELVRNYNLLTVLPLVISNISVNNRLIQIKTHSHIRLGHPLLMAGVIRVLSSLWATLIDSLTRKTIYIEEPQFQMENDTEIPATSNLDLNRKRKNTDNHSKSLKKVKRESEENVMSNQDENENNESPVENEESGDNVKRNPVENERNIDENVNNPVENDENVKPRCKMLPPLFVHEYLNCMLLITPGILSSGSVNTIIKLLGILKAVVEYIDGIAGIDMHKSGLRLTALKPNIIKKQIYEVINWDMLHHSLQEYINDDEDVLILGDKAKDRHTQWLKQPFYLLNKKGIRKHDDKEEEEEEEEENEASKDISVLKDTVVGLLNVLANP